MRLFNRKKHNEPYIIQYRLHMVCVIEDFNQMQQRDFVAVDIEKRQFYRVHEQIGNWGESRYFVNPIEGDKLSQLLDLSTNCNLGKDVNDWLSLTTALQGAEIVEITKAQIRYTRKNQG